MGLIECKGITKRFGEKVALDNLSVDIPKGKIFGLLGPNGAGKTTTFYMIVGFYRPTQGEVFCDGKCITKMPMYKRAHMGISYLPQEASVFRKLTVEQNIYAVLEKRRDLTTAQKKAELLDVPDADDKFLGMAGDFTIFVKDKFTIPLEGIAEKVQELLEDVQKTLYDQAKAFRDERTTEVHNMDELGKAVENGFARAMWCGDRACEDEIKDKFNASSRNMPFDQDKFRFGDTCVCCGKKADRVMYFAKAY